MGVEEPARSPERALVLLDKVRQALDGYDEGGNEPTDFGRTDHRPYGPRLGPNREPVETTAE
jgi:hypothetical protein